jgi:hypothetical protein
VPIYQYLLVDFVCIKPKLDAKRIGRHTTFTAIYSAESVDIDRSILER